MAPANAMPPYHNFSNVVNHLGGGGGHLPHPQMVHMAHQAQQQPQYGGHILPADPSGVPNYVTECLEAAYRVGMLAMQFLGTRRAQDERWQTKFSRNPPYGDFVKWLLGISKRLGVGYVKEYCSLAGCVVTSPFVLWDIANETAAYLLSTNQNGDAYTSGSQLLLPLLERCIILYALVCHHTFSRQLTDHPRFTLGCDL